MNIATIVYLKINFLNVSSKALHATILLINDKG